MTYRHPSVFAAQAMTIDHASHGRLELSLGAAWFDKEHHELGIPFPSTPSGSTCSRTRSRSSPGCSPATSSRTTGVVSLHDAQLLPVPVQQPHPPIWIGGSGPRRTLPLVAKYADVWHTWGTPNSLRDTNPRLDELAAEAGRDPASIMRASSLSLDDLDTARKHAASGATRATATSCAAGPTRADHRSRRSPATSCPSSRADRAGGAPGPPSLRAARRYPSPRDGDTTPVLYAQSGGVHIAYQVVGEGDLDLVLVQGFASHLDVEWENPAIARFFRGLASFSRLIRFDKRGLGLSDRNVAPVPLEERMDDVRAVMDAVGSERAVLMGISEGVPMSILFAATYPERTQALVLYGGMARATEAPGYPWGPSAEGFAEASEELIMPVVYTGGDIDVWAPSLDEDPAAREWLGRYRRAAMSPDGIEAVIKMFLDIDVRHVLPTLHVPTLVLHRHGDRVVNWRASQVDGGADPGRAPGRVAGSGSLSVGRRHRRHRRRGAGVPHRHAGRGGAGPRPRHGDVHRRRGVHRAGGVAR